jgi:hypothetical protein
VGVNVEASRGDEFLPFFQQKGGIFFFCLGEKREREKTELRVWE